MIDELNKVDDAQSADSSTLNKEELLKEYKSSDAFKEDARKVLTDELNAFKGKIKEEMLGDVESLKKKAIEEYEESRKKLTPEQQKEKEYNERISKLEQTLAEKDKRASILENAKAAESLLKQKKINVPDSVLNRFVTEDVDKTTENVNELINYYEELTQSIKQQYLKSNNIKVPENSDLDPSKTMKRSDFERLSPYEQAQAIRSGKVLVD